MTRGAIDAAVIRRHLSALDEILKGLEAHRGKSAELLRSTDERWIVERGLQLAAQNVLDIATHLVAGSGLDAADYASAIDRLADIGVVTPEFAAVLRPLAGFRNVLVHGYLAVDPRIVHDVLNHRVDDLQRFSNDVETWLAKDAG